MSNFTHVVVLRMKPWRCHMERPIGRVVVFEIFIHRQQIHVVHRDVVEVVLRKQKPNVDQ